MNPRVRELIGIPYVAGGAAPEVGFDCWGLVEWARRHVYGLETPTALEIDLATVEGRIDALERSAALEGWHEVGADAWREGDVVLMSSRGDGRPHHCGILGDADGRLVVHAHEPIVGAGGQVYAHTIAALSRVFARVTVHQWRL